MSRSNRARIAWSVIIGAVAVSQSVAAADAIKGAVVVARTAPTALLIWDASAAVGDLVIAQQTGDAGMRALEADAVAILASRAATSHAPRMEIRVQYSATGVVGAAYDAQTFANATPLVVVGANRAAVAAHAHAWQREIASGRTPRDLSIRVVGSFPQPR